MAELLIMRNDKSSKDPETDAQMYKRGDVVNIMEDGHEWSRLDDPDTDPNKTFILVRVPGLSIKAAREEYLESGDNVRRVSMVLLPEQANKETINEAQLRGLTRRKNSGN